MKWKQNNTFVFKWEIEGVTLSTPLVQEKAKRWILLHKSRFMIYKRAVFYLKLRSINTRVQLCCVFNQIAVFSFFFVSVFLWFRNSVWYLNRYTDVRNSLDTALIRFCNYSKWIRKTSWNTQNEINSVFSRKFVFAENWSKNEKMGSKSVAFA